MTDTEVNPLRRKLEAGGAIVGTIVSMASPPMVQTLAGCGLDWLILDMEHGAISIESAQAMIAATAVSDCVPLVRVAWNVPWLVKPVLDAGALGVVFPMIRNAGEAAAAVAACRYPPAGERGWGPFFAPSRWGLDAMTYTAQADRAVMRILLIEHVDAVRDIDAILAVEGIDAAVIAPYDLSTSLERPGDFEAASFKEAVATAERAIRASGVVLGGLAPTAERANALLDRGYRMIILGYDVLLLENALRGMLGALNRPAPGAPSR
ncbi:aldolase/citrate lyase family protein [Geminicoccaceae bacterium 1502E]|nr:aldolase/citrate lyase family protein [Geminicoccaceae bacterium 1502E]